MTELGEVVNKMMKEAFPTIVDVNFTANMEALLDGVSEGTVDWKTIVSNFYPDLEEAVQNAEKELEEVKVGDEESDEVCELCGRRMVIKYGPHGRFLACPGFPECRNTKPYYEKIGVACPKCGKDIVLKRHRRAENTMAVSATRSAISWYGRDLPMKSARSVAPFFWKRATNSYARRRAAVLSKRRKKKKTARDKFVEEQKR